MNIWYLSTIWFVHSLHKQFIIITMQLYSNSIFTAIGESTIIHIVSIFSLIVLIL